MSATAAQSVLEVVDELPRERVLELHLAGGQEYDGYRVDAHSDLIPEAVMDLARRGVPLLPNLEAIIYEVMPDSPLPSPHDREDALSVVVAGKLADTLASRTWWTAPWAPTEASGDRGERR